LIILNKAKIRAPELNKCWFATAPNSQSEAIAACQSARVILHSPKLSAATAHFWRTLAKIAGRFERSARENQRKAN